MNKHKHKILFVLTTTFSMGAISFVVANKFYKHSMDKQKKEKYKNLATDAILSKYKKNLPSLNNNARESLSPYDKALLAHQSSSYEMDDINYQIFKLSKLLEEKGILDE